MLFGCTTGFYLKRKVLCFMIVDIPTHTFPSKFAPSTLLTLHIMSHTRPFTDGTQAGLEASMARAGVDCSLVLPVATAGRQVRHINDASARLNEEGRARGLLSFGCMHPDFEGWKEELGRVAALGLKGIKLHPVYQDVDFDDVRYLRILDRCGELGLIVLTHAGLDIGFPGKVNCSPEMVLRAVEQVGPVTLILAHMGGWRNWEEVERLLPQTSVYLDTAFSLGSMTPLGDGYYGPADLRLMEGEDFVRMVRAFGTHRVLFGTDSPWGGQAESLALLRALPLTPEEQSAILGDNARRLLGLD